MTVVDCFVIFCSVLNALWCCGILFFIFPCVKDALVLCNFVFYFLHVEGALVLWKFVIYIFCFGNTLWYYGILWFIFLHASETRSGNEEFRFLFCLSNAFGYCGILCCTFFCAERLLVLCSFVFYVSVCGTRSGILDFW